MKKPILSICIPTANRKMYLRKTIDSIVSQQPFIEGKIEVVISDNSSNDDTAEMIKFYMKEHGNIRYYKNEKNVGNINFALALERGTGVYRKLANDTLYYKPRSLVDMVYNIESNLLDRPILLWKIYPRINKEYIKTTGFETIMRSMSFWSTWIASYGIWEEEAADIVDDCVRTSDRYQYRFMEVESNGTLERERQGLEMGDKDQFWQLRYLQSIFERKRKAVIVDAATNWVSDNPPKRYGKGVFKWVFLDYYMDILNEFKSNKLISESCVNDLKRDLGFSFLVMHMLNYEFHDFNVEYEAGDHMIQGILEEYKKEDYYYQLYEYYQGKRQERLNKMI